MMKDRVRLGSARRRTLVVVAMALVVPLSGLASSSAMAVPKGIFKIFKQCPTETPGNELCFYNQTTGGEFVIGTSKVPIKNTITFQGGAIPTGNPENPREFFALPAKNGETLSKTPQNVPGGLASLINCEEITGEGLLEKTARATCKKTFESGVTGVTATAELVATAKNPIIINEFALSREEGTGVTLPIRAHLENPFLGKSCFIGSASSPLELHLTTGETHPPAGFKSLHGALGNPETLEEKEQVMLRLSGDSLVDNTFPVLAPGAEGCGELLLVNGFLDGIVNGKLKIPNKEGENAAIFNGTLNSAAPEAVIASEKF
jgi:hypothetical protein